MLMLNLSAIPDDMKFGVLCETLSQVEMLIDAVKTQRPDVTIRIRPEELRVDVHANRAYYLNYRGDRLLQHGNPSVVRGLGLSYLRFEELWVDDLPDIEGNQTGILSLLGL